MDLISKLNSLLAPAPNPANRSRNPAPAAGAQQRPAATRTFAETLAGLAELDDPSILPFGVQPGVRGPGAASAGTGSGPTVSPGTPPAVIADPVGPTILPDVPEPLDPGTPPTRDTLDDILSTGQPDTPHAGDAGASEPGTASEPTATETPASVPAPALLPPIGVLWASKVLLGTGASGPGVGGSDAQASEMLIRKHELYSNPAAHGVTLNQEARLFLDAVSRGYVPNTPEGLGTLLGYLSMGSFADGSSPARPAAMTAYFNQFYAAERAAAGLP